MASQTFLERLRQSRLLSDEQLAQVERRFAANLPMHEVTTSLARGLSRRRYQDRALRGWGLILRSIHAMVKNLLPA